MWSKKRRKKDAEAVKEGSAAAAPPLGKPHNHTSSQPVSPNQNNRSSAVDKEIFVGPPPQSINGPQITSKLPPGAPQLPAAVVAASQLLQTRPIPVDVNPPPQIQLQPPLPTQSQHQQLPVPVVHQQQQPSSLPPPSQQQQQAATLKQAQTTKLLANPNLKPSLTVPLPSAPLSTSILDSLGHDSALPTSTSPTPPASNSGGVSGVPGPLGNLGGSIFPGGPPGGKGSGPAALNTTQHLQKVIETQRTQIALLSQITQNLSQFSGTPAPHSGAGTFPPAHVSHMTSHPSMGVGQIAPAKGIVARTQTFDYGNQSNKVLEKVAAQQMQHDYNKWS